MRLVRTEAGLAVGHHDKWLRIDGIPGFDRVTRLGDVVGRLPEIAAHVAQRGDTLEPVGVSLDHAPTLADLDTDLWGAGLNYRKHSEDLEAQQPASGPGSYLRPTGCLIGNGGTIELPTQSQRVTAEAELGLIIGTVAKNVDRADWRQVVAGVTTVLDLTAEDVIRENPRYIPWAKGFDTFCSVGPVLVTLDELGKEAIEKIRIATIRNGEVIAEATPASMKYDIGYLVEYFTAGRTLLPGTVIATGTPGAAVISSGDHVQAVVEGIGTLSHPVR